MPNDQSDQSGLPPLTDPVMPEEYPSKPTSLPPLPRPQFVTSNQPRPSGLPPLPSLPPPPIQEENQTIPDEVEVEPQTQPEQVIEQSQPTTTFYQPLNNQDTPPSTPMQEPQEIEVEETSAPIQEMTPPSFPSTTETPPTSEPTPPSPFPTPSAPPQTPSNEQNVPGDLQPISVPQRTPVLTTPTPSGKSKSSSAIAIGILTLLAISGIAGATFLYSQNQSLKQQLDTLNSIQEQREIPQVTPTPEITPESTPSATPSASPIPSPTPTITSDISAFANLSNILGLARQESSTAQLLMITSDDIKKDKPVFKYWFRRAPSQKSYFFVQYETSGEAKLFTSANVTPDNNIPDLIEYFNNKQLGIDVAQANKIALEQVVKPTSSKTPVQVTAKYLRSLSSKPGATNLVNLWQLTYKMNQGADIVVQIDANTSEVLFHNLPSN